MSGFKDPSYLDRKSTATDAKKAALEKFRARLSPNEGAADVASKPVKTEPAGKAAKAVPAAKPAATKSGKGKAK
jgi:hypothetical protein